MATPHPSYPPLDLASSGVVVLTNSWPGKPDLSKYSSLIHIAKPEVLDLSEALGQVLKLEKVTYKQNLIEPYCNSWDENFEDVICKLSVKLES